MPGLRRSLIVLVLVLLVTACSDDGPLSIREIREIEAARARWVASPVRAAYRFEVRQLCFCPPENTRWNTVTVVDDVITEVRATESGEVVPAERRSIYPTVEKLFGLLSVRDAEYLEDVQVRFDPQYGYPVEITMIAKPEIADGGGSTLARNLQPIAEP